MVMTSTSLRYLISTYLGEEQRKSEVEHRRPCLGYSENPKWCHPMRHIGGSEKDIGVVP